MAVPALPLPVRRLDDARPSAGPPRPSARSRPRGTRRLPRAPLAILLLVPLLSITRAGAAAGQEPELGTVDFPVSCSAAVQPAFNRALALLHHMMYEQSREAFAEIVAREPACAMAHWGFAMTQVQPLWYPGSADGLRAGSESVRRARELAPPTGEEDALLTAAEALFADPESTDWWARLRRWASAMEAAHTAHPEQDEIAALYALSKLAAAQTAEDRVARNAEAAAVLHAIHERSPRHPGASHYLIHANDVTGREGMSLEIVRGYDEIAPSMPHALHMPTHIFVRLGEWSEVLEWNRRSADAALRFPYGDRVSLHYPHALDYMLYAHLQRGEDAAARAVLEEAAGAGMMQENFGTAYHLAVMPARYAVERREWEAAAAVTPGAPDYIGWAAYPWAEALSWFARGLGAVHTGQTARAREAETRMRELQATAEAAGTVDHARYIEIDRLVLAGWIAHAEGDPEEAARTIRRAADLEASIQKHPITPGALLPPYEALGDLYTALQRPAEALAAYRSSLGIWPKRFNSLLGAARAARAAGDETQARAYYRELLEVTEGAETDRPGVREARGFASGAR